MRDKLAGPVIGQSVADAREIHDVVPAVYQELRRLAQYYMQRESPGHTLQATALVHEVYLKLTGSAFQDWENGAHFISAAARTMRNLLVDHARARRALKRGKGWQVSLEQAGDLAADASEELVAIHDALGRLAELDPRQSQIVELRYFGGLSTEETAAVLNISDRTVRREWQMAKAWLHAEIRGSR